MIYLDWAASAPPYEDIAEQSARSASLCFANPSSAHSLGKDAMARVDTAREKLARCCNAEAEQLVFTSGGTEADAIVLLAALMYKGEKSVVISGIEHAAVYEQARVLERCGIECIVVPPRNDGRVMPDDVAAAVRSDTVLVCVMALNNETGAVQPVSDIARALSETKGKSARPPRFHCDAVQSFGLYGFNAAALGIDSAAVSAHKIGGPRGVGLLYTRHALETLARGGGQERGLRAGTYNTAGIEAFALAAERAASCRSETYSRLCSLERRLIEGLRNIQGARILPECRTERDERYSPHIVCASFAGLAGETMARLLDGEGIAVSTGAACSGAKKNKRVLSAMGVRDADAFQSIRVSTGRGTSEHDIDIFLEKAEALHKKYAVR